MIPLWTIPSPTPGVRSHSINAENPTGAPGQAARLLSRYRSTPGPQVTRGAVN